MKTKIFLAAFALMLGLHAAPTFAAETGETLSESVSQKYDPRTYFHLQRGHVGKGYTRYYGRRLATGQYANKRTRNYYSSRDLGMKNSPKANTSKRYYGNTRLSTQDEKYAPVRYFHRNSLRDRNYTRYQHYQHFTNPTGIR